MFWYGEDYRAAHRTERALPNGRFQLIIDLSDGFVRDGAPVDWAEVALAGGYCDQAHLANEFRDLSGITPGAYLASDRPFVNHVPME
jgi:AraC-like DNA-binding protein